ncbi:signal peptidase [Neisseria dumasiana]|uniref:Signal peptidase n=1 Tax=Neisseria dumasiana TaxID=1931275 RepID=A0A1X3DLZ7_9NEIS|nr:signal peptidase [Neisseria dumasiana]OSI25392.1 signal peptidase [Neisseria dumasiana]
MVSDGLRPLQNPHLRRISALCAARSFAYLYDMSALAVLLRVELHPHLRVLQRSRPVIPFRHECRFTPGTYGAS